MDRVTELTVEASCQAIMANLAILARVLAEGKINSIYWFREEYRQVMARAESLDAEVDRLYHEA